MVALQVALVLLSTAVALQVALA